MRGVMFLYVSLATTLGAVAAADLASSASQPSPAPAVSARAEAPTAGTLLVFSAQVDQQWDLFAWDPDAEEPPRQLTHTPEDELRPALSADRGQVAYETTDGRVRLVNLVSGEGLTLPSASDIHFDMHPCFARDGESLMVVTSLAQQRDDTDLALISLNSTKAKIRRLECPSSQFSPTMAPDGRRFAYVNVHSGGWVDRVTSEIWIADLETRQVRQITLLRGLSIDPSWTPDGKRILFAARLERQYEVYRVDVGTETVEQLTHEPCADTDPVSHPDGKGVLFVSTRGGSLGLWLMRDPASKPVELRPFGDRRVPCKDPDWK